MKDCVRYQEMICGMIDGELNSEERKELMAHIALCPECKATYEAFSAISMAVGTDLEEVPEALHENIMAGVRRSAVLKKNKRTAARQTKGFLAAAACFAVVVMSAVGISGTLLGRRTDVTAENAAAAQVQFDESGKEQDKKAPAPAACSAAPTAESTPETEPATPAPLQPETISPVSETAKPAQDEYLTGASAGTNGRAEQMQNRTQDETPIPTPAPVQTIAPLPTDTPLQTIPPLQGNTPAKTPKATEQNPLSLNGQGSEAEMQRSEASPNAAEASTQQAAQGGEAAPQSAESGQEIIAGGNAEDTGANGAEAPMVKSGLWAKIRAAAQSPLMEPDADSAAAPEESDDQPAATAALEMEPAEEESSITHKISKAFKSMFGIAEPSSTAAPEKPMDVEADVIVDMTEEKDYEAFAALLLGKLAELPEGNADRVYLFQMKNGDMIIELLAYAYGDDIYYTIYDEVVQQNVYLADCKQSELESFIAPYSQQPQPDSASETIEPSAAPAPAQIQGTD